MSPMFILPLLLSFMLPLPPLSIPQPRRELTPTWAPTLLPPPPCCRPSLDWCCKDGPTSYQMFKTLPSVPVLVLVKNGPHGLCLRWAITRKDGESLLLQ